MEASSSSKVTVEYHDPSGVFSLISHNLTSRLPLRNLNWQSHARPLRQIKHLHVEFVPSPETQAALRLPKTDSRPPDSIDILRSGFELPKATIKERRHQIPGLKTTPYLKLYILRCDDKDWYKQEEKRKLKEWVHDIKAEDNHDAFEWLIIHVVIPDTVAASEPRWRESSRDPDELKERSKSSKKTVLDRLRTDFNDGKNGIDHIAQIRLSKSQIAIDLLPVPALAKTIEETADERERSWSDLITKFRTSILSSFDARVRRYEDDIAEQESRRSFPAWNFCTFFIHKEGLAKALESVGLVEDALAIYDELSLDLETVLTDIASGEAMKTATSFPTTRLDIIDRVKGDEHASNAQRIFNKDYREEIVRSAISIFDFFCYLFERQTSLILRLAGRSWSGAASGIRDGGDDLVMLAEICWRGLSFIHNAARALKQDMLTRSPFIEAQSLVSSWTYTASAFVLTRTQSQHLDLSNSNLKSPGKLQNGHIKPGRIDFGFGTGADAYPQRGSSLPVRKAALEVKSVTSTSSAGKVSDEGFFSPPSSSGTDGVKPAEVPGLAELAAYRAELVALQRKTVDVLASMKGWHAGWNSLAQTDDNTQVNVDITPWLSFELVEAMSAQDKFEAMFEFLTESAARHYLLATHAKAAENLMGDLAILKFSQGDFASAATHFEHALPTLQADGWREVQLQAQALYIISLRSLGRHDDAVRHAFELRAVMIGMELSRPASDQKNNITVSDVVRQQTNLETLLQDAAKLPVPFELAFEKFFTQLTPSNHISHEEDKDGFRFELSFRHMLESTQAEAITLHLSNVETPGIEVILRSTSRTSLETGLVSVQLESNVTSFGMFHIDKLTVKIGNATFQHDFRPQPKAISLISADKSETPEDLEQRPCLLLYPGKDSFSSTTGLSNSIVVHKARYMTVVLHAGHNNIQNLNLRVKPATAGLRIHLNDVSASGIDISKDSHGLELGSMSPRSTAEVNIRYSMEHQSSSINARLEVEYTTATGTFLFIETIVLQTGLSLDVEVKDVFHYDTLFSTFTIRTTNGEPVLLRSVDLTDSASFSVQGSPCSTTPTIVLARQPVDVLYKITCQGDKSALRQQAGLEITIDYTSIRDLISSAIATNLRNALLQSHFSDHQGLILSTMTTRWPTTYTHDDMNLVALLNEVKVPSFTDLRWMEIIDNLPTATQRPLSDWLMKWHIENQRMPLDPSVSTKKRITINVDVPSIEHAFISSISLKQGDAGLFAGQAVPAQIVTKYTSAWSIAEVQGLTKSSKRPDFIIELHANPDVWLISGRRRIRFTPSEVDLNLEVILVPLRTGISPLPTIVVRPASEAVADQSPLAFEATCLSAGKVVYVLNTQASLKTIILEDDDMESMQHQI